MRAKSSGPPAHPPEKAYGLIWHDRASSSSHRPRRSSPRRRTRRSPRARPSASASIRPSSRPIAIGYGATISGNGRYVAFYSDADNLVTGDTNGVSDIFVRDCKAGTTTRISLSSAGTQADGESLEPHMSRDGRYVIFWSRATNLAPNINDGSLQTYWRDLATGTTAWPPSARTAVRRTAPC